MDELVETTSKELATVLQAAIDKSREETAKSFIEEMRFLREQVEQLSSIIETGPKTKYKDSIYYESYDEIKNSPKFENLSEAAFLAVGGISQVTPEEDSYFQVAARDKARYSPFIRNIINLVGSATLSTGIKIDIPNEEVDTIITNILTKAKFNSKLKGFVRNEYTDGEIFIARYMRSDGTVKYRTLDAQEITEIEYHPEDKETVLAVKRDWFDTKYKPHTTWYAISGYEEQKEDEIDGAYSDHDSEVEENPIVFFFRYGYREGRRGETPLLPVLRYDRIYEDVLLDLARLYHERSSVAWILKLKGNNPNILDRTDRPVRGAKIKIETDNKVWRVEDVKISDFNSDNYAKPHRLAIAAGVGIPEYLLFQDISNASYASLRAAGGPFDMLISSIQDRWVENIQEMVKDILKGLVKKGKLKSEYEIAKLPSMQEILNLGKLEGTELKEGADILKAKVTKVKVKTEELPVSVIFPTAHDDNPLLTAQATSILVQAGIMSRRTAMKLIGLDPENENALISVDRLVNVMNNNGTTQPNSQPRSQQPETNYANKMNRDTA
jgi:hypothetical protein